MWLSGGLSSCDSYPVHCCTSLRCPDRSLFRSVGSSGGTDGFLLRREAALICDFVSHAPHRTVLVDFPHAALQLNSLNLLKYKNHVLFVAAAVGNVQYICWTSPNSFSAFGCCDLTISLPAFWQLNNTLRLQENSHSHHSIQNALLAWLLVFSTTVSSGASF